MTCAAAIRPAAQAAPAWRADEEFLQFRQRARQRLAQRAAPADTHWPASLLPALDGVPDGAAHDTAPLFDDAAPSATVAAAPHAARVPPDYLPLARRVALHRDPARFDLLYRLLWRLQHEPMLRHDRLDADWLRLRDMAKHVQRDLHKMRAFVRFRPVHEPDEAEPLHVAWFEPVHRIVPAIAPWFSRRFANQRWAILTPEASARWCPQAQQLHFGPGAQRADAPAPDAGENLWLVYYQHTFNPARLNLPAMQREMPRRYWHNLPEAAHISALAAGAAARAGGMIGASDAAAALPVPTVIQRAPKAVQALQARTAQNAPVLDAASAAAACHTLPALYAQLARCAACPLAACATQAVPGVGAAGAHLMLVGEQPGDEEDLAGRPFVGPAGRLLHKTLAALALPPERLYLTNAVRHFGHELRGKRRIHKTPGQREAAACAPWLAREVELVAPRAVLALGATAARAVLGHSVPVTQARGQPLQRADGLTVFVTWHPSALLRMAPDQRRAAEPLWRQDIRLAAEAASLVTAEVLEAAG